MGREFELKYRADKAQLEEIAAVYGPFREIAMETTYYDAPSGVFSRLHWTLRRRLENGVSVCTLKSNLPDGSRGNGRRNAAISSRPCPGSLPWVPPESWRNSRPRGCPPPAPPGSPGEPP